MSTMSDVKNKVKLGSLQGRWGFWSLCEEIGLIRGGALMRKLGKRHQKSSLPGKFAIDNCPGFPHTWWYINIT